MNEELEQRIRELAYSLWQSAERPYWRALEYWLMAETMVLELMVATAAGVTQGMASSGCAEDR